MNRFSYYYNNILARDLILKLNIKNTFEIPKLSKIVLNTSSKKCLKKKQMLLHMLALELISGQKVKKTKALHSIATFKLKQNDLIGAKVTLRNDNMYNFLDQLTLIILPRINHFTQYSFNKKFNQNNFTLGLNQFSYFPQLENKYNILEKISGLDVTFVLSKNKNSNIHLLLSGFKIPFKKLK